MDEYLNSYKEATLASNMEYECNLNSIAKNLLGGATETPFNKEFLQEWRRVAIETNVEPLYNTPENYE